MGSAGKEKDKAEDGRVENGCFHGGATVCFSHASVNL
jgi:hypothetical protein